MTLIAILAVLAIALAAGAVVRKRAAGLRAGGGKLNSLPIYHAVHVLLWSAFPALVFVAAWAPISKSIVNQAVLSSPAGQALPAFDMQRNAILAEANDIARGAKTVGIYPEANALAPIIESQSAKVGWAGTLVAALLAAAGAFLAARRSGVEFRARTAVERWVMTLLVAASMVAVLTTLGIILSLLFESLLFFKEVSIFQFLTGSVWSPAGHPGSFGSIGLFWGTAFIGAIIAMIVAVPLGLMSAIYLTQYAPSTARRWIKPTLEILAGVPTVVYGYFAALTVGPAIRDLAVGIGITSASSESALAAGLVMGIMIIPLISSMSDDSITAVPQSMRDGSLALGATRSETIKKVLLPAALPGVVGGILLAVSRAIGETMIVVMAAGLASNLTANPFASVTTVTVQIVQLLTGDQEFDSAKTLAAFALGLILFIVTLILNLVALRVVRKYREAYD
ncbi:phosphate ABC transporter permease subunit PstC [Sphingomonas jaspsi]|uniref:phosphate ABC transporter permease subunit PstC n=1 Tax=Sphingomonas jaspsi TaxID=392409 RepID=UPI0004AC577D|nr:phosphate ABC transporter permease subunit PstC [Sphingomonas jaspsi]